MSSLVFLVPIGILLGVVALAAFLWSLRSGQYEDLDGAAARIFLEEDGDRASAAELSEREGEAVRKGKESPRRR